MVFFLWGGMDGHGALVEPPVDPGYPSLLNAQKLALTLVPAAQQTGAIKVSGGTQDGIYLIPTSSDENANVGKSRFVLMGHPTDAQYHFDIQWSIGIGGDFGAGPSPAGWAIAGNDANLLYYSLSDVATPDLATDVLPVFILDLSGMNFDNTDNQLFGGCRPDNLPLILADSADLLSGSQIDWDDLDTRFITIGTADSPTTQQVINKLVALGAGKITDIGSLRIRVAPSNFNLLPLVFTDTEMSGGSGHYTTSPQPAWLNASDDTPASITVALATSSDMIDYGQSVQATDAFAVSGTVSGFYTKRGVMDATGGKASVFCSVYALQTGLQVVLHDGHGNTRVYEAGRAGDVITGDVKVLIASSPETDRAACTAALSDAINTDGFFDCSDSSGAILIAQKATGVAGNTLSALVNNVISGIGFGITADDSPDNEAPQFAGGVDDRTAVPYFNLAGEPDDPTANSCVWAVGWQFKDSSGTAIVGQEGAAGVSPWDASWLAVTFTQPVIQTLVAPSLAQGGVFFTSDNGDAAGSNGIWRNGPVANGKRSYLLLGQHDQVSFSIIWNGARWEVTDVNVGLFAYSYSNVATPDLAGVSNDGVILSDTFTSDFDGGYAQSGTLNSRPKYDGHGIAAGAGSISWSGTQWEIKTGATLVWFSTDDVATPDLATFVAQPGGPVDGDDMTGFSLVAGIATGWKNASDDSPATITVTSVTEGELGAGLRVSNDGVTNGASYVSSTLHGRQYYMGLNGGGSNNLHWDTDFNVWTDDVGVWTSDNVAFPWQGTDNGGGHTGATFARDDVASEANWQ